MSEDQNADKEVRTAVVFIHGVGVQDRYQQLTQFTDGLVRTSHGAPLVAKRRDDGRPLGAFVPLTIREGEADRHGKKVDVHEVYWAPLLNGLSKWSSVLLWAVVTLWRSNPINRKLRVPGSSPDYKRTREGEIAHGPDNPEGGDQADASKRPCGDWKGRRPQNPPLKFPYECLFSLMMASVAICLLWIGINAMVLASDQSAWGRSHVHADPDRYEALVAKVATADGKAPDEARKIAQSARRQLGARRNPNLVSLQEIAALVKGDLSARSVTVPAKELNIGIAYDFDYTRRGRVDPLLREVIRQPKALVFGLPVAYDHREAINRAVLTAFWRNVPGYLCSRERREDPVLISELKSLGDEVLSLSLFDIFFGAIWLLAGIWLFRKIAAILRKYVLVKRKPSAVHGASPGTNSSEIRKARISGAYDAATAVACVAVLMVIHRILDFSTQHLLCALVVFRFAQLFLQWAMENILADCQIYFTRNENSARYAGREAVLERTRQTLEPILKNYDRVIIVGHSLGSVVGLDTIRRMYTEAANGVDESRSLFDKIAAFVTLGSPLEKSRYFFASKDYKSHYVEFSDAVDRQIFAGGGSRRPRGNTRNRPPWFNFWTFFDIVSNPLVTYPVCPQHDIALRQPPRFWPHSDYWIDPVCVQGMLRVFTADEPAILDLTTPVSAPPQPAAAS